MELFISIFVFALEIVLARTIMELPRYSPQKQTTNGSYCSVTSSNFSIFKTETLENRKSNGSCLDQVPVKSIIFLLMGNNDY